MPAGRAGLRVEAGEDERAVRLLRLLDVVEELLDVFGVPHAEDRVLHHLRASARQLICHVALEQPAFEGHHVEAHLLVQELDETDLGLTELGHTVTALAELDDAAAVEDAAQELQVGVLIARGRDN